MMKKQLYLCVDLKTYTQESFLHPGQSRTGVLSMSDDGEEFFFCESVRESCTRNMKVFRGQRLNVTCTRSNSYVVTLKKLELTGASDPLRIADEIFVELEKAKEELGL